MSRDEMQRLVRRDPEAFARALARVVRAASRRTPAPASLPYFGLDHPEGCGSRLLDRLCDLGIFRYYERVLDLGTDLGGPARWLARRRGCRVVTVVSEGNAARAAGLLVAQAALEPQVRVVCGRLEELPVREAAFTHVWSVEQLHRVYDKGAVLRQAFRAVRPGGHIALQEWAANEDDPSYGGWFEPASAYCSILRVVGFVDVRVEETEGFSEGETAMSEILWHQLGHELRRVLTGEKDATPGDEEVSGLRYAGRLRRVQVFGTRPA